MIFCGLQWFFGMLGIGIGEGSLFYLAAVLGEFLGRRPGSPVPLAREGSKEQMWEVF